MLINTTNAKRYLKEFDFRALFIEELGWDRHTSSLQVAVDAQTVTLSALANKRGMVAYLCSPSHDGHIPDYPTRRKIEMQTAKAVREHLIIYADADKSTQVWQWVKREAGKPLASREHTYHRNQSGDALIQKLDAIAFSIAEEESVGGIVDVVSRFRAGFDVERVTKKFYERFKTEHDAFLKFLDGIPDKELERWYVSVMLNRLMFIYFVQKKGFLDNDTNYLRNRLAESKKRGKDRFYRDFLASLFFEGFAKKKIERSRETNALLGNVPYLDGGLFQRHQIEELCGKTIQIPDAAFARLFEFFDQYQWHLDERPLRADNEINPDVLGYIFEKYINQKQMGAYYTKEDITGYISQNTVIPFLFDAAKVNLSGFGNLTGLDPDRYIYDAVKHGASLPLPPEIVCGLDDVSRRTDWNKPAPAEYALPTEIWREVVARRQRYEEIRSKITNHEIENINNFITYNLNIRQFAQDVIANTDDPTLLRAFWHALERVSVLDPTVGSGAFLFAALNILESLYEACLERMQAFVDELDPSNPKGLGDPSGFSRKYSDFRAILARVAQHPNRKYFVYKSIVVNNLYGVDIMEEAVEICKLRLFLKLVAQIERVEDIEPLPDIDFNIRAGNTLVGFATYDEVRKAVLGDAQGKMDFDNDMQRIDERAEIADRAFKRFREMQTEHGMDAKDFAQAKNALRERLKTLEDELNHYLAREYGVIDLTGFQKPVRSAAYEKWRASHRPFHWFIEFYGILKRGGFDVIIGNPPYVEYSKVRKEYQVYGYNSEACGNLYAFVMERSVRLLNVRGSLGLIVPISLVCTQRMETIQDILSSNSQAVWLSTYAERPSKLFVGAEVLLTIALARLGKNTDSHYYTTGFTKWASEERPWLFERTSYSSAIHKVKPFVVPKVGSAIENSILAKLSEQPGRLGLNFRQDSKPKIYYRIGGGRYWKIFTNFQPRFVLNGKSSVSSRENYLYFDNPTLRNAAIAVLSSSLFYWYFILTTNCRDLNTIDLQEFPINLDKISSNNIEGLSSLCENLMTDYKQNSQMKEKTSSLTGNIVYQEFYPRLAKPIIDEIDRVLARHYGFTDAELDFIINYDIKYRMGREAEE